jgi:hypothetical protein
MRYFVALHGRLGITLTLSLAIVLGCSEGTVATPEKTQGASATPTTNPVATSTPPPNLVQECTVPKPPPADWPKVARAALQALIDQYKKGCATTADFEYEFYLPAGITKRQRSETVRWYTDALKAGTRIFGYMLKSTKPIAVFYKSSAKSMCNDLLNFLQTNQANSEVINLVETSPWACQPDNDWLQSYNAKGLGYSATVLAADAPGYDYIILNMGSAVELRSDDPYQALMPTFQTPSHELFHLAQMANLQISGTTWLQEGSASYMGRLSAAMQGMVSYKEARQKSIIEFICGHMRGSGATQLPSIKVYPVTSTSTTPWYAYINYEMGVLASEYVLGMFGWEKFSSWASDSHPRKSEYEHLDARSRSMFGMSLEQLNAKIDAYIEKIISKTSC